MAVLVLTRQMLRAGGIATSGWAIVLGDKFMKKMLDQDGYLIPEIRVFLPFHYPQVRAFPVHCSTRK
jgi:hypothetical protein